MAPVRKAGSPDVLGAKSGAKEFAREVAQELSAIRKRERKEKPAPTLEQFWPRYVDEWVRANRRKPETVVSMELIYGAHLAPMIGRKRLNEIDEADVQRLKLALMAKKPKTVNNILSVLRKALKIAIRWQLIRKMPAQIDPLKADMPDVGFYEPAQYRRLIKEAAKFGHATLAVVLLGGDAGLRRGEIIALAPTDLDMKRGLLTVRHSDFKGELIPTKSFKPRVVPMTKALRAALRAVLPLAKQRLLTQASGAPLSVQSIRTLVGRAQKSAGLPSKGALHILRHTFCSRLAMNGATVLAIKELAGHKSIRTTLRYMHLTPDERNRAIALLERGRSGIQRNY